MALLPPPSVSATIAEQNTVIKPAETVSISWPSYGQSALYSPGYGDLATDGTATPTPIASITKIITVLTVLDAKPLNSNNEQDTITFTQADVELYNSYLSRQGTVGPVTPGVTMSRADMVRITLISSANNYADQLAIDAFGSMERYLQAANAYVRKHDLTNTTVADASGFSPNTRSTAQDLVHLGALALENEFIATAVDTAILDLPQYGVFRNTSILLARDESVLGIKTGTTDEAGSCLLYAQEFEVDGQTITVIGAILGGPNGLQVANDAATTLNSVQQNFEAMQLYSEEDAIAFYVTPWGDRVDATPRQVSKTVLWSGSSVTATTKLAELSVGDTPRNVGTVALAQNGVIIEELQLETTEQIEQPGLWWRITHPHLLVGAK